MRKKLSVTGWKDWINVKVLQKAVLIDKKQDILLICRSIIGLGARKGKWDLPGGSMDADDFSSVSQNPHILSIQREVKEETQLEANNFVPIFVSSGVKIDPKTGNILILAICYKAKVPKISPRVTLSKEHVQYQWVSKKDALSFDFGEDGGFHKDSIKSIL